MIRNRLGASARGTPRVPSAEAGAGPEAVQFDAYKMFIPGVDSVNWQVDVQAPDAAAASVGAVPFCFFVQGADSGRGWLDYVPADVTTLTWRIFTRPAPSGAGPTGQVAWRLYVQPMPDGGPTGAWQIVGAASTFYQTIPADGNWHEHVVTISLATSGLIAAEQYLFELIRFGSDLDDTYTNDMLLTLVRRELS